MIIEFIWSGKRAKIRYEKLIQNYNKAGLKLIDLEIKNHALKAMWPIRWKNRKTEELGWSFQYLPVKSDKMWSCNLDVTDVKKLSHYDTLSTMTSILESWCKVNFQDVLGSPEQILSTKITGNSLIRRRNAPIFEQNLVNSNIIYICDIYDLRNKKFKVWDEVKDNYGSTDQLQYCGVRAAIPKIWKIILKESHESDIDTADFPDTIDEWQKSKRPSQNIYWKLLEIKYPFTDCCREMWEKDLNKSIEKETWDNLYEQICHLVKPTKLLFFQYRVLNKLLLTNVRRSKWAEGVSNKCMFCKESVETIKHSLVDCKAITTLWVKLNKICKYFFDINLEMNSELIILNNYMGHHKEIINFMILVMKQYIYCQKCFETIPTFSSYMEKLAQWQRIDLVHAWQHDKIHKCKKKWNNLF